MAGRTDGLIKNYRASGAVPARTIVKFGAGDTLVSVAAATTDMSIGVTLELDAADGERLDVAHTGIEEVRFGGNVARGDWLTSDGTGRAVTANPGAGVKVQVIGKALASGVANDIGPALIQPTQITG